MSIREDLMKAAKVKAKKKEAENVFITRLVNAVMDLGDEEWNDIPEPAAKYANKVSKILLKHEGSDGSDLDLPGFPDESAEAENGDESEATEETTAKEASAEEDDTDEGNGEEPPKDGSEVEAADAEDEEEKQPKKEAKKMAKPAKKPEKLAKNGKAEKASETKDEKRVSMRRRLKQFIVKNPALSVEQLIERLKSEGYQSPSKITISTMRADTRDTMKVLSDAGKLDMIL